MNTETVPLNDPTLPGVLEAIVSVEQLTVNGVACKTKTAFVDTTGLPVALSQDQLQQVFTDTHNAIAGL